MHADLARLKRDTTTRAMPVALHESSAKSAAAVTSSGGTPAAESAGTPAVTPPASAAQTSAKSGSTTITVPAWAASRKTWGGAATAIVVGIAAAIFVVHKPAGALTDKDLILVTDFTNTTGDAVFDGTLRSATSVGLGQSPYLNVVSDQKVQQTLKLMGLPAEARITPEIGRQICTRNGVKAMLTGSIAAVGTQYLITLNAVNAASGDNLAQEQVQAAKKEEVLSSLGTAVSNLRGKLGESLSSVKRFDKPLEEATTSSLEALKSFSDAVTTRNRGDEAGASAMLKHAIELDPNFALATAYLGATYSNMGQTALYEQYLKQAF